MRLTGLSAESLTMKSIGQMRQAAQHNEGSIDDMDRELGIVRE
ncbi:hypothetical protein [Prauserella endophytica]|nr:hypothetical protein [Prauserella endophytica]